MYGPASMHISSHIFSNNLSPFWRGILCEHPLWIAPLTIEQMTSNANLFSDYASFFSFVRDITFHANELTKQ